MQASHAQALVQQELERQQARTASRVTVEAYVKKHRLDKRLQDAVNEIVKTRPEEPMQALEDVLSRLSAAKAGLAARVTIVRHHAGTHAVRVTLVNHYGEFSGDACSVLGADSDGLQAAAEAAGAAAGESTVSPLVAYAGQCGERVRGALGALAQTAGADVATGGGAGGGALLVSGTAATVDDALAELNAESESGLPAVHRAVRLAASFASLKALAAAKRRSTLQMLVASGAAAATDEGPATESPEAGAPAGALLLPVLSFQALAGAAGAVAAWDAVDRTTVSTGAGGATALAALLGGGAAGDAAATGSAGRSVADRQVLPFTALGVIPLDTLTPEPEAAGAGEEQGPEGGEEGVTAAAGAGTAAAGLRAARPAEAQRAASSVATALASVMLSLGVQCATGAGGAPCPSLQEAALLRGATAAAELACVRAGADTSEAASRAAAVIREAAGAYAALPDAAETGPGAAARKRAIRGCWLLRQALSLAAAAGPVGSTLRVSLLAGASEWTVSPETLASEEEARAAAAAASDAKGAKKKPAAKAAKASSKKGAKAEPEAEAPADELDDESADTDGPIQYDVNAAAGPAGAGGASVAAEGGEVVRARREVVGSEGLRRLLLRAARMLPVVALGEAFTDGAGEETSQAAKLVPALRLTGVHALTVATGRAEVAADRVSPPDRAPQCACVNVAGPSPPGSVTELLAELERAAAGAERIALRVDGCDAVDEAVADVAVAAGVGIVFLGSPFGGGARAVTARLEGLAMADASIVPRCWADVLPVEG